MKIPYKHLIERIISKPSVEDISTKLFQLGHEHDIIDDIFDIEITPNRGDCLSLNGILRDLKLFYDIADIPELYMKELAPFNFNFINNETSSCKKISFLKIEIDNTPSEYKGALGNYFKDLSIKKNNFFTDVSNFISYETGQPTHCYDHKTLNNFLELSFTKEKYLFKTLFNSEIELDSNELVFLDEKNNIVNFAGIIGGKETACKSSTKSAIVECAYFDPEIILGKAVKYDIQSEAAYKFERNTDISCHEYVLRRFLYIVNQHTSIKNVEIFSETFSNQSKKEINFDCAKLNKILGTEIKNDKFFDYLLKLGFSIKDNVIEIPFHRNDINHENDIAEEVARAIGYNNINKEEIKIEVNNTHKLEDSESKIKSILIDNGFFEVINNPFVDKGSDAAIKVDNPLDSNKSFLRTDLKHSLINNLLYNERRQHDSIKLFEISNVYDSEMNMKRVIGIIASGRVGKNYKDFSKKIDNNLISSILKNEIPDLTLDFMDISRSQLDTKLKNKISYIELDVNSLKDISYQSQLSKLKTNFHKYEPISDFPSSIRDISFTIFNESSLLSLEDLVLNQKHKLLKDVFVFDYFKNPKSEEIKLGFRFIFQSKNSTVTDEQVDVALSHIIEKSLLIDSVSIRGL
jgi:phenylalanyl-tRNA synthetase beta chain